MCTEWQTRPQLGVAGRTSTGSVNVAWQLTPVTAGDGGFVVVRGSHKATVRTGKGPDGINGLSSPGC